MHRVAQDGISPGIAAAVVRHAHARAAVEGDDVALAGIRAADEVARSINQHARAVIGEAIAQRPGAGRVGADEIALHAVAGGITGVNLDSFPTVAGNLIAFAGIWTADERVEGQADREAVVEIGDGAHAVGGSPEAVALKDIAHRVGAVNPNAAADEVAADDIARAGSLAADDIGAALREAEAVPQVGQRRRAGDVHAEVIALQAIGVALHQLDAVAEEI